MAKMIRKQFSLAILAVFVLLSSTYAADIILNEYNAVANSEFLNGGNASADDANGRASDSYFGRVQANGGDWFEMVVITDHLDMRNWRLDVNESGDIETLNLTNNSIWSDLRSGTIITVAEDVPSDISYNPAAGDWWINVQASNDGDGLYIETANFPVSSSTWQLTIRDEVGAVVFGPAGEGISPTSGVGPTEIFRLEAHPDANITPLSSDYDDAKNLSTFGAPNRWGMQDLNQLRTVVAQTSSLLLLDPNGSQVFADGTVQTVTWQTQGTIDTVLVEFSDDNANSWSPVCPANEGNTGAYNWLVPILDSQQCLIRIANPADLTVYDTSDATFTIYECSLSGDLTGNCGIDMFDFAVLAQYWLQCDNPYDPQCN